MLIFKQQIQWIFVRMQSKKEAKKEGCQEKKIDKYVFSLKQPIGQGAYATVYLGRGIITNEAVAVKVIDKSIFVNAYNLKNIEHEISIMKRIDHPNIVKLLDVYQTTNNMYIVTEYCEEGDLAGWLKTKKKGGEKEALRMLKDIMEGFKYLVSQDIMHRDLKPANILLKKGICKICDFGFAKDLSEGESTVMRSIVGTPLYMSPQILARAKYTNKSDLWSVGLIYYELIHGHTPWPAKNQIQLINNIMAKPIVFDNSCSERSKDFVRGCLKTKEDDRMTWDEAFNHPLLREERKSTIKILIEREKEKENDKENIVINKRSDEKRLPSPTPKRDVSDSKREINVTSFIERNTGNTKTPPRSRISKIPLTLTPNNMNHTPNKDNDRQKREPNDKERRQIYAKSRSGATDNMSPIYSRKTKPK